MTNNELPAPSAAAAARNARRKALEAAEREAWLRYKAANPAVAAVYLPAGVEGTAAEVAASVAAYEGFLAALRSGEAK